MPNAILATDGRTLGAAALRTRRTLLNSVATELKWTPYRDVRIADIARRAKTSNASFYQYFPDLDAAVLALAEDVARNDFASPASATGDTGREAAAELVDAFFRFYHANRTVLRAVEAKAAEGDERFAELRQKIYGLLTTTLEHTLMSAHPRATDRDARAATAASLALLVMAAAAQHPRHSHLSADAAAVRAAVVDLLHAAITRRPTAPLTTTPMH
ncbi:hypothetical protein ACH4U6_35105 [Streptomyces netropsis]|uniref:hypothetical protein n=1 Tax=Streptomyces netropsis TaxID=55404 RepID=UPI0037A053DC